MLGCDIETNGRAPSEVTGCVTFRDKVPQAVICCGRSRVIISDYGPSSLEVCLVNVS